MRKDLYGFGDGDNCFAQRRSYVHTRSNFFKRACSPNRVCASLPYTWVAGSFEEVSVIVQADFPDHWKTDLLVKLTGSETAVRCLLRFWAHCQMRKQWKFQGFTPAILAGVCKWQGDPQVFWDAMLQTFCDYNNNILTAHEWDEVNASLIGRWKGGETNKRKLEEAKLLGKLKLSHSDRIRGDMIREDGKMVVERKVSSQELNDKPEIPW